MSQENKQWFAVHRSYRVKDTVFIQAGDADEARTLVADANFEHQSEPEPIKGRLNLKVEKRRGIPRWLWEELGYPEDVPVAED